MKFLWLAGLLAAASAVPSWATDPVVATTGTDASVTYAATEGGAPIVEELPSVQQRGSWQYQVPIEIPPTETGFAPSLSVLSSHAAKGGVLGNGWELSVGSRIERRGPTGGPPMMDGTDTYWLGDQQMYPFQFQTTLPNSILGALEYYRLEQDDSRIFIYSSTSDTWQASRQGQSWSYGGASEATGAANEYLSTTLGDQCRDEPWTGQSDTVSWSLSMETDKFGNSIDYRYDMLCDCAADSGEAELFGGQAACSPVLGEISFGTARVQFDYVNRPDPVIAARLGRLRVLDKRLSMITTLVESGHVELEHSRYRFLYNASDRLTVRSTDPLDGIGHAGEPALDPLVGSLGANLLGLGPNEEGDLGTLRGISKLGRDDTEIPMMTADINRDRTGFADAQVLNDFGAVPDYFTTTPFPVNFDGDAYTDLALVSMKCDSPMGMDGCEVDVRGYHNVDDGSFGFVPDPVMTDLLQDALPQFSVIWGVYRFADVDADGRTELHVAVNTNDPVLHDTASYVLTADNDDYEILVDMIDMEEDDFNGAQFADVDGDGFPDIIYPVGPSNPEMIAWERNTGEAPYFDGFGREYLPNPIDENPALTDSLTGELRLLWDQCIAENGDSASGLDLDPWTSQGVHWQSADLASFQSDEHYWLSQSRATDINGDGAIDLAFSFPICWKMGDELTDMEPAGIHFSRIYFGDGRGGFLDSELTLPTAFMQPNSPINVARPDTVYDADLFDNWNSFSIVDLNADGNTELVYRNDDSRRLRYAHWQNIREGFGFDADTQETRALPATVRALSSTPSGEEAIFSQSTLIQDFNADGFPDLLIFERNRSSDTATQLTVSVHENTRSHPNVILEEITNQFDGTIKLSYLNAARNGDNPELSRTVWTVDEVSDHRGTSRFSYSGGRYEDRRFLGFAEVEGEYESGLLYEAKFSLRPEFRGKLVSRAERRSSGSLARFTYNSYIEMLPTMWRYDMDAPFFNPLRRRCTFEVDPALVLIVNGSINQAGLEDDLIRECLDFQDREITFEGLLIDPDDLIVLHGWIADRLAEENQFFQKSDFFRPLFGEGGRALVRGRNVATQRLKPETKAEETRLNALVRRLVKQGVVTREDLVAWRKAALEEKALKPRKPMIRMRKSAPATRTVAPATASELRPAWMKSRFAAKRPQGISAVTMHAAVPQNLLDAGRPNFVQPGATLLPMTPEYRMFVKDYEYFLQRLSAEIDYRMAGKFNDDHRIDYQFAPTFLLPGQPQVTGYTVTDDDGDVVRSFAFSEFAGFDTPEVIEETGQYGVTRGSRRSFDDMGRLVEKSVDRGVLRRQAVTEIGYATCGVEKTIDAVGRLRATEYDRLCRISETSFEGGVQRYVRDDLGRITQETRDNGVASIETIHRYYSEGAKDLSLPWSAEIRGERLTLRFVDKWGRVVTERICRWDEEIPEAGTQARDIRCLGQRTRHEHWGYADDGALRFHTRPYFDGETAKTEWYYRDAFWRITEKLLPSHDYTGPAVDMFDLVETPRHVSFRTVYRVGETRTVGPDGRVCKVIYDTLSRSHECDGVSRGSEQFNEFGHTTRTTQPSGVVTSYGYDNFFRINAVTALTTLETCNGDAVNPTQRYLYDFLGNRTRLIAEDGVRSFWTYDAIGRPLTYKIRRGAAGRFQLNAWNYVDGAPDGASNPGDGRRVLETDINGNVTTSWLDGFGTAFKAELPDGSYTLDTLDDLSRVSAQRDIDGLVTHYGYNVLDRKTREYHELPLSSPYCTADMPVDGSNCQVGTSFSYDGEGRLAELTDADGVTRSFGYTDAGDAAYYMLGDWLLEAQKLDDYGNVSWAFQGGAEIEVDYDDLWRPNRICRGADGGACGVVEELTYTPDNFVATQSIGGHTQSYETDYLGRVTSVTDAAGETEKQTWSLNAGICKHVDKSGHESTYEFDALGLVSLYQPQGTTEPRKYGYEYGVDLSDHDLPGANALNEIIDADGGSWKHYFDFANRPVLLERPDGSKIVTRYDGSMAVKTELRDKDDLLLEIVAHGYDALNRTSYEWGPVSPWRFETQLEQPAPEDSVVWRSYTPGGRLAKVETARNVANGASLGITEFDYNAAGLLKRERILGVTEIETNYDSDFGFPRIASVEMGAQSDAPRVTEFSYSDDGLYVTERRTSGQIEQDGRLVEEVIAVSTDDFDVFGTPRIVATERGVDGAFDMISKYARRTDALGRIESTEFQVMNKSIGTATYQYFVDNDLKSIETDWAGSLEFGRDALGQIESITGEDAVGGNAHTLLKVVARDPLGRMTEGVLKDDAQFIRAYDQLGRMSYQRVDTKGGAFDQRTHGYDIRGRLISTEFATSGGTFLNRFGYTTEGWLEEEVRRAGSPEESVTTYSYDGAGNRRTRDIDGAVTAYSYGSPDGSDIEAALMAVNENGIETKIGWDAYGGMIEDHRGYQIVRSVTGHAREIWDKDGYFRIGLSRDHSGRTVHSVSAQGERVHFWDNPVSTVYPLSTIDEEGVPSMNAALGDTIVGRLFGESAENAFSERGGDLVLSNDQIISLIEAFGTDVAIPTSGFSFIYGGQEYLADVPYLSAQQRLFDPETGRFASVDPMGLSAGANRFQFVSNDPLRRYDPWGMEDAANEEMPETELQKAWDDPENFGRRGRYIEDQDMVICNGICPEDGKHSFPPLVIVANPLPGEVVETKGPDTAEAGARGEEATVTDDPAKGQEQPETEVQPVETTAQNDRQTDEQDDCQSNCDAETAGDGGAGKNGEIEMPENFNGDYSDLKGRLADGYSIDADGLLRTPSGNIVIPGINDAQNPLPHKVLINMAGKAVDDAANFGIAGSVAKMAGLWEGNGTPGSDAAAAAGFGYTASEKPREMLAETSMGIAMMAAGSGPGRAAANSGRSLLARGCSGPLGQLPGVIKRMSGITCFAAGTMVATESGPVPIEEIKEGDLVECRSDQTMAQKFCPVEKLYETENRALMSLSVAGESGPEEIRTTPNHRFYVKDLGWREARDLSPGQVLSTANGATATVTDAQPLDGSALVYNFEVAEYQTYFVGENRSWVHNGGTSCTAAGHRAIGWLYRVGEDGVSELVLRRDLVSGGVTRALLENSANAAGRLFPRNAQHMTHTETRFLNDVFGRLQTGILPPGNYRVVFLGELPPCSRCKGAMNSLEFDGVQTTYIYFGDAASGIWQSAPPVSTLRSYASSWARLFHNPGATTLPK
ncbi:polymorphic toxin-type HINT domain-containing protein [Aliiruegeria sabulilitoris]|uniref:polymorphic toxin-type HINT domain-containing protein n=1 Tax=Aliiruegeria sabulilitoris TaxID=1510458 RepID=UPI00082C5F02|nr:polymorphic toxin-type HINT domain-containing protein [Aliiruegeria sabulilitoris]